MTGVLISGPLPDTLPCSALAANPELLGSKPTAADACIFFRNRRELGELRTTELIGETEKERRKLLLRQEDAISASLRSQEERLNKAANLSGKAPAAENTLWKLRAVTKFKGFQRSQDERASARRYDAGASQRNPLSKLVYAAAQHSKRGSQDEGLGLPPRPSARLRAAAALSNLTARSSKARPEDEERVQPRPQPPRLSISDLKPFLDEPIEDHETSSPPPSPPEPMLKRQGTRRVRGVPRVVSPRSSSQSSSIWAHMARGTSQTGRDFSRGPVTPPLANTRWRQACAGPSPPTPPPRALGKAGDAGRPPSPPPVTIGSPGRAPGLARRAVAKVRRGSVAFGQAISLLPAKKEEALQPARWAPPTRFECPAPLSSHGESLTQGTVNLASIRACTCW